jgi:predicted NBD/HSP70 family sugar kinase
MRPPGGPGPRDSQALTLDVIRAARTISRVELARQTGLTEATISTVVRRLINEGLVAEVGREESTGGKPRVRLSLVASARFAVGIQFDHTSMTSVIADLSGAIVARRRRPGTGSDAPEDIVRRIAEEVEAMIRETGMDAERLLGVGVVFPGPLATPRGMLVRPPTMRAWTDFPLVQSLEAVLNCPVLLDNDATAAAIGEYWTGATEATSIFATMYMGTGIGAGLMARGAVYRGASSNAGEIGHICVDCNGPRCWCGGRGCLETLAGPSAVVAEAIEHLRERPDAALTLSGDGRRTVPDFAVLARAAMRGHGYATGLLRRSATYLGMAAQTIANLLDLDTIVLSGPCFTVAGSLYVSVIQEHLSASFVARDSHGVEVRLSANTADAPAVGAAALVLQSELAPEQAIRRPQVAV